MRHVQEFEGPTPNVLYLGCCWIENTISKYRQGLCPLGPLRKRKVVFPERQFAAALTHLYVGAFSLDEIAGMVSSTPAELAFLRTQLDFMMLVDAAKVSFAQHFREDLSINEYSPFEYASIAAEYAIFEELARNQIRVPLFRRMQQQGISISDKVCHNLRVELHDLRSFKRLFSFFVFEECFLQTLKRPSFDHLRMIAKEIVWHRLGADYEELDSLLCTSIPRRKIKEELKGRFERLELH